LNLEGAYAARLIEAVRYALVQEVTMLMSYGDPFETLFALQRALEGRLASDWIGSSTTGMGSYPPINIFQKGDDLVAIIELPGVEKNDLQIEAKENTLRIAGKKVVVYEENASVHRRERVWGNFDRTFSLPIQVNPDGIRAEYLDGVLSLLIPRAEREKPRSIKIS
jgi:HSP20 family protein